MSEKPPPFPDFYAMWRDWYVRSEEQWSEGISSMLKDETVAEAMGKQAQQFRFMQKIFADWMQRYLSLINFPSRTDIEKLAERMGKVEDSVAALEAEIVQLRSALIKARTIEPAEAGSARPPRTRKPEQ